MIFKVILKDLVENLLVQFFFFKSLPPRIRIRIHMDIFWILDTDPHNNRCGSATPLYVMDIDINRHCFFDDVSPEDAH